jgi:CTP:molybdopterin cytidylyltransferase MocA
VIAAIVLAAGAATRFGSPKQRLLLPEVLRQLHAAPSIEDVVVVTGAHAVETEARTVGCPDWERGPGASLRCGLAALPPEVGAAVVVLADGPDLDPRAVERVVEAWRASGAEVVRASYGGVPLHPVLLARSAWGRVPDDGARGLGGEIVVCDDCTPPGDVDTREQLAARRANGGGGEPGTESP